MIKYGIQSRCCNSCRAEKLFNIALTFFLYLIFFFCSSKSTTSISFNGKISGLVPLPKRLTKSTDNNLIVPLLMNAEEKHIQYISSTNPRDIAHNVAFIVDLNQLKHPEDLLCDDLGSWKQSETSKKFYLVCANI